MPPTAHRTRRALGTGRRFLRNAVQRRANPQRFIENDLTPHGEILHNGMLKVRHYPALATPEIDVDGKPVAVSPACHRVPLVLVPPLGVHAWIFDLMRERSLVRYFLARGFDVYLIDWGAPGPEDHGLSLDTYVNHWFPQALAAVRTHSGRQELSLLGYCMGGLLSLMYIATSHDRDIRNLVTIASPVDFHRKGAYGRLMRSLGNQATAVQRWLAARLTQLDQQNFHVPGRLLSIGFHLTNPRGSLRAYLHMVRNLADTEYVTGYMSMGQWFNDMPDYPGGVLQEMTGKFAIANQMARGQMTIGDAAAPFGRIDCNLLAFAGQADKIVDVEAARHLLDIVGSADKTFVLVNAGHAGIFAGSRAPAEVWRTSADWLSHRSG